MKNAEEIAIFKLKADATELLWENANGTSVNIGADNITPVYGEIADINGVKYIKTKPFTYPLGVEEQEVDNCKIYVSGNEIIINGAKDNSTIKIFDFMGRAINETKASENEIKVNISEKGFYLVSIFEDNNLIKTEKVIVK